MNFTAPDFLEYLKNCLTEDVGAGDYSSIASIPLQTQGHSIIYCKESGILAGLELAEIICNLVDDSLRFKTEFLDGHNIEKGDVIAEVFGSAHSLLKAERLLLNFMQRLSAIATQTNKAVQMISHTNTSILDTRKTTPGLRLLEKWAVKIGGGQNHRIGLYDMIMLKDNHIDCAGGISNAVKRTEQFLAENNLNLKIEVETRNLEEVIEASALSRVDRIMFDNFTPEQIQLALPLVRKDVETEASGGIGFHNLVAYAETGVQFISLGLLTHSVKSLDISMKTKLN